jgi:hypothetical protein
VTIKGVNFIGVYAVSFGGTPAASFTVVDDATIVAVTGVAGNGDVVVSSSFGTGKKAGFVHTGPPIINSFSPKTAGPGATITIAGKNIGTTNSITLGGASVLRFTVINHDTVKAVVNNGSTGDLVLTTPYGSAAVGGFTYVQAPTITSFSPASGPVGTVVTITGSYFSPVAGNNIVFFGAVQAAVTAASSTSLTVTVPAGITYENLSVTTNKLTAYSSMPFLATFDNYGNTVFGSGSFTGRVNVKVDYALRDAGIADLDGDGRPDIAVVNQGQLGVSVLQNTTSGGVPSFAAPKHYPGNGQNDDIALKDINGDGKPDMVSGPNLWLNTSTVGNIQFGNLIRFWPWGDALRAAMEDLDGDGRPELVTVTFYGETMNVYRNASTIDTMLFEPKLDFNVGGRPYEVCISDIDGDKKADVIVSDHTMDGVRVFRNTSQLAAISFAPPVHYSDGDFTEGVAAGDLDGDGKTDVVSISYYDNTAIILRNTSTPGTISFQSIKYNANVQSPGKVALDDMNGDGRLDMVISNGVAATVFANTSSPGNISFANGYRYLINANSFNAALGDLNADGKPDIVSQYQLNGDFVSVLYSSVGALGIRSFSPASATTGDTVRIVGTGFTNVTSVDFGGTPAASFTVDSAKGITAVVAAGSSGNVRVITSSGTASAPGFTYKTPPPVITSFTPASGTTGTTVSISGVNFTGVTAVSFGGVPAKNITVQSPTNITATVGAGATGNVQVTTATGSHSLAGFTYLAPAPAITSFTPLSATTGDTVTITGVNLTGATAVNFGGVTAKSYQVVSPTVITAVVGEGASGGIDVITPGGTGSISGFTFVKHESQVTDTTTKQLWVYPNPSNNRITVKHPAGQGGILRIIDSWGRVVKRITTAAGSTQTETSVSGLLNGIYRIMWNDGDNKQTTTLMVQ